jgi:hypothetical protein
MRIDSESAHPIQLEAITTQPFLLKSLFRGGRLDVELMKRLNELSAPQVLDDDEEEQLTALASHQTSARVIRFRELFSKESGLFGGQGYMPGTGQKATELLEMNGKRLTKHDAVGLFISASRLQPFTDPQVHRRRDSRIYRPPLVLISEGFFESTASIRSRLYLGRMPLIFNRSFYGYSTLGHPKAEDLAKYLFILASSDLFAYYILQSSAKAGVERRTVLEEDVGDFPVVAFSSLDKRHIKRMREIVKELSAEEADSSWRLLNDWVYELYSLTANDKQVIKDTLDTRMPFDAAIRKALRPATGKEKREFVGAVTTILTPFFKSTGETIQGTLVDSGIDTWVVFDVHTGALNASSTDAITKIALLIADQETSTRVMQEMGRGRLRVAIRNQYRYLTKTRARLCAIDILRDKSHLFPVGK